MRETWAGLSWPGLAVITADRMTPKPTVVSGFRLRPGPWGQRPCSTQQGSTLAATERMHCVSAWELHYVQWTPHIVGVGERRVTILEQGAWAARRLSFIHHRREKKKRCKDPPRPTGVRPSCQQTWGGDHSLRFYFCRLHVIIKQLST